MHEQDAGDPSPDATPSSPEPADGAFGDLLGGDGLGTGLLGGNDFADLISDLQSNRPEDPHDAAGGQPVDDPQYDTDPYPYGIADL